MSNIRFDYSKALPFVGQHEIDNMAEYVKEAHNMLHNKTGAGNDFLGWVNLPTDYDKEEFARIKKAAEKIRSDSDVLVVIGIGGSYLGARAAVEMLQHSFYNALDKDKRKGPAIFFAGNNISSTYMADLLETVEGKDISVNVISKSGTTTEPAIAFRIFKNLLEKKYGKEGAKERIYATTDKEKGALKTLAENEGYEQFVVPDNVGGRYSVLTAVGLLPIAVAGIDIEKLMEGARIAQERFDDPDLKYNECYQYAVIRNILYSKMKKTTEILVNYEPKMHYFTEWWKQLYGESEGKDNKGVFPVAGEFSEELHSVGQFIQDGSPIMFETFLDVKKQNASLIVEPDEKEDYFDYLDGKDFWEINKAAYHATVAAHSKKLPCLTIEVDELDAYHFGQLFYFFQFACYLSCKIMGVNPFDQPGVEAYKKWMFEALGK